MEEWRTIPSLPNYEASNCGRVRSIDHWTSSIKGRRFFVGQIRKATPSSNGRPKITAVLNGRRVTRGVHVLVLETFIGPRPAGMVACHSDGDLTNNAAGNLRWDTRKANEADKLRHGTDMRGERNHAAKLSTADVDSIKRRLYWGETNREIALDFGVHEATISQIKRGKNWPDVGRRHV